MSANNSTANVSNNQKAVNWAAVSSKCRCWGTSTSASDWANVGSLLAGHLQTPTVLAACDGHGSAGECTLFGSQHAHTRNMLLHSHTRIKSPLSIWCRSYFSPPPTAHPILLRGVMFADHPTSRVWLPAESRLSLEISVSPAKRFSRLLHTNPGIFL